MSLTLLVIVVVIGIAAIVVAVHVTGGTASARLETPDQARQRFAVDFPREEPKAVWLTGDGLTAFLDLGDSRLGLVQGFGDRFLTRIVSRGGIAAFDRPDANAIDLSLGDFTWRGGTFRFDREEDAGQVADIIERMKDGEEAVGG